jgi:hypothetical protein
MVGAGRRPTTIYVRIRQRIRNKRKNCVLYSKTVQGEIRIELSMLVKMANIMLYATEETLNG